MPESPVVYEDVEVLHDDALGFVCRIGNERVLVSKYLPIDGTNLRRKGDRGRLALPRWFVEQQGLPLARHLSDREVEECLALTRVRIAAARERVASAPNDADEQAALERAEAELASSVNLRARRHGG